MRLVFRFWLIGVLWAGLCGFSELRAQGYGLGLNPSSMRWFQLVNEHGQVIYPAGQEAQARRTLDLISALADSSQASIGYRKRPIPIILHGKTTVPNGFVAIGPFRSEFYLSPPQFSFLGSGDWLDILAIHEYRHVQQNTNARVGVTKLASWLFGQFGWATVGYVALPRWFMEGDAICIETAYSASGRGRLPRFDMVYRAQVASGRRFGYEKASAGSYRQLVPNHYYQGYYMTAFARLVGGDSVWRKAVNHAADYDGLLWPLSHTLKKQIGMRTPQLYRATFDSLARKWQAELAAKSLTPARYLTEVRHRPTDWMHGLPLFTHYQFPRSAPDGRLLVVKSSLEQIHTLYLLDSLGKEQQVRKLGQNTPDNYTLSVSDDSMAVWAERTYHPRWANVDYSVIRVLELGTGKTRQLTHRSRYFAPAISKDGKQIVAVEALDSGQFALTILDAQTGEKQQQIGGELEAFFSLPTWLPDGSGLIAVVQKHNRQSLQRFDLQSCEWEMLLPWTTHDISHPYATSDRVFFSWAASGTNEIYSLSLRGEQLTRWTSSRFGAFQPMVKGQQLFYAAYTEDGYRIAQTELKPSRGQAVTATPQSSMALYKHLVRQENSRGFLDTVPESDFERKRFRTTAGLLNLHSWSPYLLPPNYSYSLFFDNTFSTLSADIGLGYNDNEQAVNLQGNIEYGKEWLVLRASGRYNGRRSRRTFEGIIETDTATYASLPDKSWRESQIGLSALLPLHLSRGTHLTTLQLQAGADYRIADYEAAEYRNQNRGFVTGLARLDFSRIQLIAPRHFLPRWGQMLTAVYRQSFDQVNQGSAWQLDGRLFFPGLHRTHSFYLVGSYRYEPAKDPYKFQDDFFYVHNFRLTNFELTDHRYKLSANYAFPIWYPDVAAGPFAFFQRLRGQAWYDWGGGQYHREYADRAGIRDLTVQSAGLDVFVDFRLLRLVNVSMGLRFSLYHDPDLSQQLTSFFFPVISF